MTKINQQLRLPSGCMLAYNEYGPPHGVLILYFHGSPSSRLEWHLFGGEVLTNQLNIRVIVPDRPGLGRSEFQPGRRIGDWPADVIALADRLTSDRFAVLGYSGGGPYAAVCAVKIPEREALRAGPRGAQRDTVLMVGSWDFRLQDVRSAVYLWHGEMDANAPLAMGRYMAASIPNSRNFSYSCEGHLSLVSKYLEKILNVLIA